MRGHTEASFPPTLFALCCWMLLLPYPVLLVTVQVLSHTQKEGETSVPIVYVTLRYECLL